MEHEDDNPELVDLLYDDELDEETAERLRADLDPSERSELEEYEELLADVRSEKPVAEVSESTHDSIMDAAREAADERAEPDATADDRSVRPDERSPTPRTGSGSGIWSRLSKGSTLTQLTVAAMALLAGGTALYLLQEGTVVQKDRAAGAADKQAPPTAESSTSPETAGESSEPAPTAPSEPEKFAESEAPEQETAAESESTDREPAADRAKDESAKSGQEFAKLNEEKTREPEPAKSRRRADESRGDTREDSEAAPDESSDELMALESSGSSDRSEGTESSGESRGGLERSKRQAKNPDSIDVFGSEAAGDDKPTQKGEETTSTGKRAGEASPKADDSSAVGELAMGSETSGSSEPPRDKTSRTPKKEAPSMKERAAAGEESSTEPQAQGASQTSGEEGPALTDVELAFKRGEWRKTISLARQLISERKGVEGLEKPRILELKARALENVGELDRAEQAYADLATHHPNYKTQFVERARKRVVERRRSQKKSKQSDDPPTAAPAPSSSSEEPPEGFDSMLDSK